MCDFHNFGLIFAGQMHCLPQRLKSTLFEIFSNGGSPKGTRSVEKISNNVDFSLWGQQCICPANMRPKLWKSHIVYCVSKIRNYLLYPRSKCDKLLHRCKTSVGYRCNPFEANFMALKVLHRFGEKTSYGNWDMLLLERYRYLSLFKLPNACKREREMKKDNKMGVYIAFYFFFLIVLENLWRQF